MTETPVCTIDGCDRPHRIYGWCNTHYFRWYRTGDPGPAEIHPRRTTCEIDGCDRKHRSLGLCESHYRKARQHGDPLHVSDSLGENNPMWTGDEVTYPAMHGRLRRQLGSAAEHACVQCGRPAEQWAYDHTDPNEKRLKGDRPYSTDPNRYEPMCVPCHRARDVAGWRREVSQHEDLFTADEVAAEVGVAVSTVYSWVRRGWLAHSGRRGRLKLFRLSDVFECEKTRRPRISKDRNP